MTPTTQLCLAYTRVSTGRQGLSTEAQNDAVRRAAEYFRLPPPEIYAESDTSGSRPFAEREEGRDLIQRVKDAHQLAAHQLTDINITLLVPKVDRLGRDSIDVNQTVRLLDSLEVRVVFLDINVDTRTAMGRAFMQIAATFAELELARIRERIEDALAHKREKGELCGTETFGWDAVLTGEVSPKGVPIRRMVDNPIEQDWILKMAAWRVAGWSYGRIARALNAAGVRTKLAGKTIRNCAGSDDTFVASGRWQQGNVCKVLENSTVRLWLSLPAEQAA